MKHFVDFDLAEADEPKNRPPGTWVKAEHHLNGLREKGILEGYAPSSQEEMSIVQVFGGDF